MSRKRKLPKGRKLSKDEVGVKVLNEALAFAQHVQEGEAWLSSKRNHPFCVHARKVEKMIRNALAARPESKICDCCGRDVAFDDMVGDAGERGGHVCLVCWEGEKSAEH